MVAGDFNLVKDPTEKSNDRINQRMIGRFRRCINDLELIDLYLNGRRYTWFNERNAPTLEKLDRVLVSMDWEQAHPSSLLSALSTSVSDHCPLHLVLDPDLRRGRRFHFEAFWIKVDGFQEVVRQAWMAPQATQNPFKRLAAKLKATAKALSSWSDRYNGSIKQQLLIATEVILRLDVAMESRTLSDAELELRRTLKQKLLGLASLQRSIARQRSRVLWLKDGDACTEFFHNHASHRRRKNFISKLKVDDVITSEHDEMAEAVDSFFANLLGEAPD
uniref:Endonuclease/exonuclease/phosphatase domain-containing protein n=1 Tax=Aegilops tauschii subsp. strangulata TaxID=200361 RepID=A0A453BNW0_AEGTS